MLKSCLLALAAATLMPPAFAQVAPYAKVGTLGLGVGLTLPVTDRLALRAGYNGLRFDRDEEFDGNTYEAEVKFDSVELLADWHFTQGWRITGGGIYNRNRADLAADAAALQSFELGGNEYAVRSARAEVELGRKRVSPYLGLGYSQHPRAAGGFGFHFDAGVMYQDPVARLTVDASPTLLADPRFQADLAAEQRRINDEARNLRWWPVISVGVTYAF